jgi:hypothetical protein
VRHQPHVLVEAVLALAVASLFAIWSAATQPPTSAVTWDAVQYYLVSSQIASGQTPAAEAPYVYRLGMPWIAARLWPGDPARGFFVVNVLCGLASASLLSLWLRVGVERLSIRIAMVGLFAAAWHGPIRYVHFNGGYVDPLYLVLVIVALGLLETMRTRPAAWQLPALTALTAVGALVRETMLLLPISALLLGNPLRERMRLDIKRINWHMLAPIAVGVAVIAASHSLVVADTTRSFVAAALQWVRKPISAYLLAWFTAFGPVLALLIFDGRRVRRDLLDRQYLLGFSGLCAVLAFFGGSDTERFLFWAMPVVYLLIARAYERQLAVVNATIVGGALLIAQAVSARIFWTIPDPASETGPLGDGGSLFDRAYAIADRVFVIDHFHWNLWSSFGSQPFRLVRLGMYLVVTALLIVAWRRRALHAHPAR